MDNHTKDSPYMGYLIIRPEPRGLAAARRQVSLLTRNLGFAEDDASDVIIAVGEAMSNAYLYGTPDLGKNCIYLGWQCTNNMLTITINDEGPGIEKFRRFRLVESMGCGIPIMKETMDNVHFDYQDGTLVVLKKHIHSN